jgi:hypothetical protein
MFAPTALVLCTAVWNKPIALVNASILPLTSKIAASAVANAPQVAHAATALVLAPLVRVIASDPALT